MRWSAYEAARFYHACWRHYCRVAVRCARAASDADRRNQGKNALRDFAATTFGAFADLKFELKSSSSRPTEGRALWNGFGEAGKRRTSPGLPATNKTFEVRGATVVDFTDGKISRNSDYWDLTTYMKQVGLTK